VSKISDKTDKLLFDYRTLFSGPYSAGTQHIWVENMQPVASWDAGRG